MKLEADPSDFRNPAGEKWYQIKLLKHPNCNDPDHPGCDKCQGLEYDEEWLDD
jgi:hypothetical protein